MTFGVRCSGRLTTASSSSGGRAAAISLKAVACTVCARKEVKWAREKLTAFWNSDGPIPLDAKGDTQIVFSEES